MPRPSREALAHWIPTVLGILVSVVILAAGFSFLYATFWPVKSFRFDKIVVAPLTHKAGDDITYVVHGCKFTDLPVDVDLQFEGVGSNHNEYPIPQFTVSVRSGCGIGINHVQLPFRMAPGTYVLRDSITTHVNRFHEEVVTGTSNVFWVIVPPATGGT